MRRFLVALVLLVTLSVGTSSVGAVPIDDGEAWVQAGYTNRLVVIFHTIDKKSGIGQGTIVTTPNLNPDQYVIDSFIWSIPSRNAISIYFLGSNQRVDLAISLFDTTNGIIRQQGLGDDSPLFSCASSQFTDRERQAYC